MGKQQLITVCMILLLIFKSYFSLKSSTICLKIPLNYQKNNSPKPLQVIICPFLREKTSTTKGLSVVVRLNLTHYEKGITIDKSQIDTKRIFYNKAIPQLSYRIAA
ncbi:MAG: hypothetical protein U5N85_11235 [Arcicella sp.]|nr:hypothetical protein [Arcicella sp.]